MNWNINEGEQTKSTLAEAIEQLEAIEQAEEKEISGELKEKEETNSTISQERRDWLKQQKRELKTIALDMALRTSNLEHNENNIVKAAQLYYDFMRK